MYACMHTHIQTRVRAYMRTCLHACVCGVCVCGPECVCVCVFVCNICAMCVFLFIIVLQSQ